MISGIERVDTHAEVLAGVIERAVDVRREDVIEPLGTQLEAQFSNYVMDQQRDAHARAMDASAGRPRASVAPPRPRTGVAAARPAPATKPSNVELF